MLSIDGLPTNAMPGPVTATAEAGRKYGTKMADIKRELVEARLRAGERQCLLKLADQCVIERRSGVRHRDDTVLCVGFWRSADVIGQLGYPLE
jgi:hypothetical protein